MKSRAGDVLGIWREWADDVVDRSINCGHFIAEEEPAKCATAIVQIPEPTFHLCLIQAVREVLKVQLILNRIVDNDM